MKRPKTPQAPNLQAINLDQAKALAHPLRRRMLALWHAAEHSPSGLATLLKEPTTKLYHHVALLAKAGLIRPTRQEPRRGTIEHFYVGTAGSMLSPPITERDSPHAIFHSALKAGSRELTTRLDTDRLAKSDEDLFLSVSTEVPADDEALSELSQFIVDWVARQRATKSRRKKTYVSLASFPVTKQG